MSNTLKEKGFLTINDAASYSSISRRSLYKFLKDPVNPLPHFRLGTSGRVVRIKIEELEKWMENFRVKDDIAADIIEMIDLF